MNKTLNRIIQIADATIKRNLPQISKSDLEENGKVYYMNGDDGTAFDWQMNGRLCEFMMFYNQSHMGAVKINVLENGEVDIYTFEDKAPKAFKTEKEQIEPNEVLTLAVLMNKIADEKDIFDKAIDRMESDITISEDDMTRFLKNFDE